MVDGPFEGRPGLFRTGLPFLPAGDHHPGVERGAEDGPARDELLDLLVVELPVAGDELAAVLVAGPDGAVVMLKGLPEALIAQVRGVENDVEPVHLREQLATVWTEAAVGMRARRIAAGSVVGRPDGA